MPDRGQDEGLVPRQSSSATAAPLDGVWVAYYIDRSGVTAFATEVEALRYAVGRSMNVMYARFGVDVWEQMNG